MMMMRCTHTAVSVFDRCGDVAAYRRHYVKELGVAWEHCGPAAATAALSRPWTVVVPGAAQALEDLGAAGLSLVVVVARQT